VYRKDPFWVFNMRGEIEVRKGVKLIGMVNNIFDVNASPIFIGADSSPCGSNLVNQNGACGNAMPGREFVVGVQVRF
jgi:vitamin B12 transporter